MQSTCTILNKLFHNVLLQYRRACSKTVSTTNGLEINFTQEKLAKLVLSWVFISILITVVVNQFRSTVNCRRLLKFQNLKITIIKDGTKQLNGYTLY